MAFRRTTDPAYPDGFEPFAEWDAYAEQFLLYVLGAGSPTHPLPGDLFYSFTRWRVTVSGYEYIRSYMNSLFVYQFSHAFLDFRDTTDRRGVDWFTNSVNAALAARQYAIDASGDFATLGENSWGLSACLGPYGYSGSYGSRPNGVPGGARADRNDGTVALYGAVASLPFAPAEARGAILHYASYDALWGRYGFTDSYNLDVRGGPWFCSSCIGIDKGIELVMTANYQSGLLWALCSSSPWVTAGMAAIGVN